MTAFYGGIVQPEIEALLALQEDDRAVRALESLLDELEPRLQSLERERGAVESHAQKARETLTAEESKLAELHRRLGEHRQLHDRSVAQLETVRTQREASAAMSQVEQVKRFVNQDQMAVDGVEQRARELRQALEAHEFSLAEITERQESERAAIAERRRELEEELRLAKMKREGAARRVPRSLLSRYDRIAASRTADAVFPLRGASCGHCDTVLPLQRRTQMTRNGVIEVCEGCGVMIYAGSE